MSRTKGCGNDDVLGPGIDVRNPVLIAWWIEVEHYEKILFIFETESVKSIDERERGGEPHQIQIQGIIANPHINTSKIQF